MSGAGFFSDLREAARQNPVSATLIGVGAVWWLSERAGLTATLRSAELPTPDMSGVREATRSATERAREWRDRVGEAGSQSWERGSRALSEAAAGATETAKRAVSTVPERGASLLSDTRDRLAELFEEQPLMLGAVGVAVGAAIAAAVPETELEAEYFGEVSDQVKSALGDMISDQAEQARSAATRAADAAMDEARRQGLTPEDLKSKAAEIPRKLSRVAEAAGSGLED